MKNFLITLILIFSFSNIYAEEARITQFNQINPNTVEVVYSNNQRMTFDFYGDNIFRLFQNNTGGIISDPQAKPSAQILVDNPRKPVSNLSISEAGNTISIQTSQIEILIDKNTSTFKVLNKETKAIALETLSPITFGNGKTAITLKEEETEYFYGGGVQNGRFSHKGKTIAIENQNSWTDGGVASPNPFYWSTNGYAIMWYTFKKGQYDFGAKEKGMVNLYHEENYFDVFFMINDGAVSLLNDFYQLTGNPVLMPKFGFYQGHLNAYNRDYWIEDEKGILFEDGKRYKESQNNNGGVKESLNGELNNYQFSARAVIDRYKKQDMPLGWLLPNDGYGAGYGQTETLDGNIQNLRSLADYANENGVEIGLWTQSDLHPNPSVEALLQRDIVKEVRDAKVRVLKTDVAWVGPGYSFGLNGISDASQIMTYYGNNSRPFIITLDGWAGTQRYGGIWSGDQTGGAWEYIRFHIPTYIGSGLSGQPNISSDMDGIFGGKNMAVNIRDFQWKTWTPMELNMDGWGSNEKYPHALGEPATSINRWYLKLKSELIPYTYSIAKEAVDGMPMIRAMFLEYPNPYTLNKHTQYQFLYGSYFLVAPIYQETEIDENLNDIRNGIYLPEGQWIDYFSGDLYEGDRIINSFEAPLWKLPVFVKNGAIIPMANPNNNVKEINKALRIYEIYPYKYSSFTEYDDDGTTEEYRFGKSTTTLIESNVDKKSNVTVTVHPTVGDFTGFVKEKATEFKVNVTSKPKKVLASIGKNKIKLTEVNSINDFLKYDNVFFYNEAVNLNQFATQGSDFEKEVIMKNPQVWVKLASSDITKNTTTLHIEGFSFSPDDKLRVSVGDLAMPNAQIKEENIEAYTVKATWEKLNNADYYEIAFNDMLYSTIKGTEYLFDNLKEESTYQFKIRAVNKSGHSDWKEFSVTTKSNPLEFAIQNIAATSSVPGQGSSGINKLFDFDENSMWHTKWDTIAVPFDIIIDLKTINQLEKFHYLPREGAGNGTILKGIVSYSYDKENWIETSSFEWKKDSDVKVFEFTDQLKTRYLKLHITEAVGNFGSGRELYIFKVPGTESYLPGDINNDGKIDNNDLTSYMNYTGLRQTDADFDYISNGDINKNGLIDAYDISVVATQLEEGTGNRRIDKITGTIQLNTKKQTYNAGEIIEITVSGIDLQSVNALSFALPYNVQNYEFIGIEGLNVKEMQNLTKDRLHSNGEKAIYLTFVNIGNKEVLEGSEDLFTIKFKAKSKLKLNLKAIDGILIDKQLNTVRF
ncbi:DUF5110 domain-containing protein [Bacteroidales bacterium OttesenSCG-928-M11]|nr:DUF5110 domain-containing protein [Bacteroidales bacterium OttesenSCG-928-M11]